MCAQIDEANISLFLSYWLNYGKLRPLTIVPSKKSPVLIEICFTVRQDDYETLAFMENAEAKTEAKLWNLTEEKQQ